MKIMKIAEDHYVVVDDSEIKKGDWCCNIQRPYIRQCQDFDVTYYNKRSDVYKKITHSTQPLEDVGLNTSMGNQLGFYEIEPMYLSEVKELIGEVDVEKKAREFATKPVNPINPIGTITCLLSQNGFEKGYNQCLEDNKDKKYTEDDVIEFAIWRSITLFNQSDTLTPKGQFELWKSIQSKTEWEVEFVEGKLKLK